MIPAPADLAEAASAGPTAVAAAWLLSPPRAGGREEERKRVQRELEGIQWEQPGKSRAQKMGGRAQGRSEGARRNTVGAAKVRRRVPGG